MATDSSNPGGKRSSADRATLQKKQNLEQVSKGHRVRTSTWKDRFRVLPDFIVIGAQKCGTWTLYHNLSQHPAMFPATRKEVHYFDHAYTGGTRLYRAHFPTLLAKWKARLGQPGHFVTGEASPFYIYHPQVPERIHRLLPEVKLIALLRDPVARAYSHYQQEILKQRETLSFAEAIDREEERLAGEWERVLREPEYRSVPLRVFSYVSRGRYAEQLERWFRFFRRDQFLILSSEAFRARPAETFDTITRFLEMPEGSWAGYEEVHVRNYPAIDTGIRDRLREYYRPYNENLYKLIGEDFGW